MVAVIRDLPTPLAPPSSYNTMSFGRPRNVESISGAPPLLGSFPLDHEGIQSMNILALSIHGALNGAWLGECKDFMLEYVKCLKENKNNNGACREKSRAYLQCRMDK